MKRFGERRALLRIIVVWAITAVALHGFARVIPRRAGEGGGAN